ncbi:DUF3732 domain-containing protein [Streptomyces sp. NPDC088194]|uniref:DUF3732 domain-containing protein n=1 Tax=Streptomyces sp. NPDC088194 TaxID=3154931 RepID=UPI00344FAA8E
MTFQIASVTVYGRGADQVRTLSLRPGELNIVTGDSRTGKTSIWTIVDYCLGSTDYPVRAGVVRDYVAVYAVTLLRDGQQVFVARPAPETGSTTAPRLHVAFQSADTAVPAKSALEFAVPLDTARDLLSDFCGIDRSVAIPASGGTTLIPSIRHTLFFCLQAQNEVANPDHLFHSQGQEWRPRAIRDVLPYFLGAVDPQQALLRNRLRLLRADLKATRSRLEEAARATPASGQALALLTEAADAGLLESPPPAEPPLEEALRLLGEAAEQGPARTEPPGPDDPAAELDAERRQLRARFGQTRARISDLKQNLSESSSYLVQAADQRERLASLNLLRLTPDGENDRCPVCEGQVTPARQTMQTIRADLSRLEADVAFVNSDTSQIQAMLADEEGTLRALQTELNRNREQAEELLAGQRAAARFADHALRAATVQGRISLYLENAARAERTTPVIDNRDDLMRQIDEVERALSEDSQSDRLASSISLISSKIWDKARRLHLEHSQHPIRLDIRRLTVVADTPTGPIPLSEMGSGENWVGYHVAAMLSLHEWFAEHSAPVPRFLILDQPSQVYFPSDYSGTGIELAGEDRANLLRVYTAIQQTVEELEGGFQVIAMEHADLDDDTFQSAVLERWRAGRGALVPYEWITDAAAE